ncbi:hypothetical protein [Burkholderia vietnamiensis]|uniref:hypothetical protein n=1 Tax=Burkholderia vietnamiensis TaxID=60552 RepID=UPI001B91E88E|nr:hypothetical protein [Burkholderia vietnamiensis]MBR8201689.1 hypothetical protein [Burkholderia vietnamiensis]
MQVKAIKPGFFAGARKYAGDVFDMPGTSAKKGEVIGKDSKPVTWVVPADGEASTGPKARGRVDSTSSTDQTSGSGSSGEQAGDDLQ